MTAPSQSRWKVSDKGVLNTAILFVDLVDSSVFASILGLQEYAAHVESFSSICERQVHHFFKVFLNGKYRRGPDYDFENVGDELAVFLHTGNDPNDVYLLSVLAITLKCAWLVAPLNLQRIERKLQTCDIAVGINFGAVWAKRRNRRYDLTGYAINLAKRIEGLSREGERFLIFLSDAAFKQVNLRMRNLIFGNRQHLQAKGIIGPLGVYELLDSCVDPVPRLEPQLAQGFKHQMKDALQNNSRDLWIHSCLQVSEEASQGCVTDSNLRMCQQVLAVKHESPVTLYYLAQGYRERNAWDKACLLLADLVRFWPSFGDGWLEYGRVLLKLGLHQESKVASVRAAMNGVSSEEIDGVFREGGSAKPKARSTAVRAENV